MARGLRSNILSSPSKRCCVCLWAYTNRASWNWGIKKTPKVLIKPQSISSNQASCTCASVCRGGGGQKESWQLAALGNPVYRVPVSREEKCSNKVLQAKNPSAESAFFPLSEINAFSFTRLHCGAWWPVLRLPLGCLLWLCWTAWHKVTSHDCSTARRAQSSMQAPEVMQ